MNNSWHFVAGFLASQAWVNAGCPEDSGIDTFIGAVTSGGYV